MRSNWWRWIACSLVAAVGVHRAWPASAFAQSRELPEVADDAQWFLGAYYRHAWVPRLMLSPWFERAPGISNDGFGITASHSSSDGPTVEIGLGYMPYHFKGAFTDQSAQVEDTEYATSKLALIHVTASVLWPIQLHRMLSLELGLGVDLGVITGNLRRTEAYADAHGNFQPCHSAGNPMTTGPDTDASGSALPYCDQAFDSHGNAIATSPAKESAAHYGVKESRVPPVMLIPMLPHLAFRFAPVERIVIKLEAAFGVAQFWVGASLQVGLGRARAQAPAPETTANARPTPARSAGRVLGKLMQYGTNTPIARAAVKTKRVFSAIETNDSGLFVFDNLEPGPVHLELTHPAYEAGSCDATIPAEGGDAVVHCFLHPQRTEGAISGQLKDEQGLPVASAQVEIAGPVSPLATSDRDGLFAVPDAPEGSYRLRVEADSFLVQVVDIDVRSRETATPQIVLQKAPPVRQVRRDGNQLVLEQPISFASDGAELAPSGEGLLREIADVLFRNRDITLLEIQAHPDERNARDANSALSQARADAVQRWLVSHGVDAARLQARGYGQDKRLGARAARVQLVIKQTAANSPAP